MTLSMWSARPHVETILVRYNIAMTLIPRGRYAEALELLDDVMANARERDSAALIMFSASALAACLSGLGRFDDALQRFEEFSELWTDLELVEPVIPETMMLIAENVRDHDPHWARRALARARDQYELLGNAEGLERVEEMLRELS